MGLAASQARLIMLTGRQNDLEFQGEQLSEKRMQITNQVQALMAQEEQGGTSSAQASSLNQMPGIGELIQSIGGIMGGSMSSMISQMLGGIMGGGSDSESGGGIMGMISQVLGGLTGGSSTQSESSEEESGSSNNSAIDNQLKALEEEDKGLQIKLEQIDTQHKAVQTEVDAVQKVIDKNIESSFKILG